LIFDLFDFEPLQNHKNQKINNGSQDFYLVSL